MSIYLLLRLDIEIINRVMSALKDQLECKDLLDQRYHFIAIIEQLLLLYC